MTDDLRPLSLWWDTLPDDLRAPLGIAAGWRHDG